MAPPLLAMLLVLGGAIVALPLGAHREHTVRVGAHAPRAHVQARENATRSAPPRPHEPAASTAWEACARTLDASASPRARWLSAAMARLTISTCAPRSMCMIAVTRPQSSCAVVGSSSALRHAALGREIDQHSAVIRVNLAPLRASAGTVPVDAHSERVLRSNAGDFRPDVGTRTTCRLINRMHAEKLALALRALAAPSLAERLRAFASDPRAPGLIVAYRKAYDRRLRALRLPLGCNASVGRQGGPVAILGPVQLTSSQSGLASSGLMAVLLALSRCRFVAAYGFGHMARVVRAAASSDADGARAPSFHYYQNWTAPKHRRHDFETEHALLRTLADAGCLSDPRTRHKAHHRERDGNLSGSASVTAAHEGQHPLAIRSTFSSSSRSLSQVRVPSVPTRDPGRRAGADGAADCDARESQS